MRFVFIEAEKASWPTKLMCRVLKVSCSGYYRWRGRKPSARALSDVRLKTKVRAVFKQKHRRYGSPRVHRHLQNCGEHVSEKRIARIMREENLVARRVKKFKVTTDSNHENRLAENLLNRDFKAAFPNEKWVLDITYLRCLTGWLYLAVVIDLYSRKVVGYALGDSLETELCLEALKMAQTLQRHPKGVLHHSDRGVQYTSADYQNQLAAMSAICSMSRKGNCWDNAPGESFFSTLKFEIVTTVNIEGRATKTEVRSGVQEYICFYNNERIHSSVGYQTPTQVEQQFQASAQRLAA